MITRVDLNHQPRVSKTLLRYQYRVLVNIVHLLGFGPKSIRSERTILPIRRKVSIRKGNCTLIYCLRSNNLSIRLYELSIPGRIRTGNRQFRTLMRYPLRLRDISLEWRYCPFGLMIPNHALWLAELIPVGCLEGIKPSQNAPQAFVLSLNYRHSTAKG